MTMPLVSESKTRFHKDKDIARALKLTLADFLKLKMRSPFRSVAIILGVIQEWTSGDNWDPTTTNASIAQSIVKDINDSDQQFAKNLEKWLPRDGEASILPGATIRNNDDF